jgi:hypothetical protein
LYGISGLQAEIVLHDHTSHLTHLVGLRLVAVALQVDELLDAGGTEDVVTSADDVIVSRGRSIWQILQ